MLSTELYGHGDPLLTAAMKGMSLSEHGTKATGKKPIREVLGHGDPLFQEALSNWVPPKAALHSEFYGHGDPVMDVVINHWDETAKDKVRKAKDHPHDSIKTEFKHHGDPLLKEYRDSLHVKGSEGHDSE